MLRKSFDELKVHITESIGRMHYELTASEGGKSAKW
jgi:hypothetical protein